MLGFLDVPLHFGNRCVGSYTETCSLQTTSGFDLVYSLAGAKVSVMLTSFSFVCDLSWPRRGHEVATEASALD